MHIFLNNCLPLKITKDDNKKKNNTYKLAMASSKLKKRYLIYQIRKNAI